MKSIASYINTSFDAIDGKVNIVAAQQLFSENDFSHFPVLEHDNYLGSISAHEIESYDSSKQVNDYKFSLEGFFARSEMTWLEVLEIFAKNNCNLIPVLDSKNLYLGYYELKEIAEFLFETPFFQQAGKTIFVSKKTVEYSIGQIVQIVENSNGKILGVLITESDLEDTTVVIKIETGDMNNIIQSFRRYEYDIISKHDEDDYIITLKERSDYLDKYLNI